MIQALFAPMRLWNIIYQDYCRPLALYSSEWTVGRVHKRFTTKGLRQYLAN